MAYVVFILGQEVSSFDDEETAADEYACRACAYCWTHDMNATDRCCGVEEIDS